MPARPSFFLEWIGVPSVTLFFFFPPNLLPLGPGPLNSVGRIFSLPHFLSPGPWRYRFLWPLFLSYDGCTSVSAMVCFTSCASYLGRLMQGGESRVQWKESEFFSLFYTVQCLFKKQNKAKIRCIMMKLLILDHN